MFVEYTVCQSWHVFLGHSVVQLIVEDVATVLVTDI